MSSAIMSAFTTAILGQPGPLLPRKVDCAKQFTEELPFIGKSKTNCAMTPSYILEQGWKGVQCTHNETTPSPHLIGTHIESRRHVMGDAPAITNIFLANPRYLKPMDGLHLKIAPKMTAIQEIYLEGEPSQIIRFEGGDSYSLPIAVQIGQKENIVTRADLLCAMENQTVKLHSMVLIQFEGHDTTLSNWPYLTNDAVELLYNLQVSILALNVPSIDRERDDGRTSNHKIFFQEQDNLIIESAHLANAPLGAVVASIKIDHSKSAVDCAACEQLTVSQ